MKLCKKCDNEMVTIVDGVFSGTESCSVCSNTVAHQGEWKITKYWDKVLNKNDEFVDGWKYEVGFHTDSQVIKAEYFDSKAEIDEYYDYYYSVKMLDIVANL